MLRAFETEHPIRPPEVQGEATTHTHTEDYESPAGPRPGLGRPRGLRGWPGQEGHEAGRQERTRVQHW